MIECRQAVVADVPEIERMRLPDTGAGPADPRMALYLAGDHHPQQALPPRVIYIAVGAGSIVGYIGGHLTRRYDCDGELQYLYVAPANRGSDVATGMLQLLWAWFLERGARRVCVDVEPDNERARGFYMKHGATVLNSHWLVWPDIGASEEGAS